ncbi:hypothetical protein CcCBS67573_g09846 [Chytriomyces confervae]|uniref:Diphthamide biosynthesis protein 4 n=1 Tax=Chytriomyces confervae TaxID=246404 RepID=A0A507DLH2_9FUNG|nr:hypothetical protein CcCBS67573_g09846 [Chytriomyces confervae]
MSHYDSLGLSQSASTEAIKRRYQRLILQVHSTLFERNLLKSDSEIAAASRQEQHTRPTIIKRAAARFEKGCETSTGVKSLGKCCGIRTLEHRTLGGTGPKEVVNGEVDLDDMACNADSGTFQSSCRCSGSYVVSEQDLEDGVQVVSCTTCSLRIRVLYSVVDEQ